MTKDEAYNAKQELFIIETCLTILMTVDAVAVQYVQGLHDMVAASRTPDGMQKYGLVQPFAVDGTVRSMNNHLAKLIRQFDGKVHDLCRRGGKNPDYFVDMVADTLDVAEDILRGPVAAYERLLDRKIDESSGQKMPMDRRMLSIFLKCIVFCDLGFYVYTYISSKKNFPLIAESGVYTFLNLEVLDKQVKKMLSYMDFKDVDGRPLVYNLNSIRFADDSMDIYDDILHIIFSAEYINATSKARNGFNPNLGQDGTRSLIESFDSETLTLEEYGEKYKNMYKN